MFRTIARHEWRRFRADRASVGAVLLFALLGTFAVVNGHSHATAQQQATAQAAGEHRERLRALRAAAAGATGSAQDPEYVLGATQHDNVVLPASPLELLATGHAETFPVFYSVMTLEIAINPYLEALTSPQTRAIFGRALDPVANPLRLRASAFDLAFVTGVLCPLVIIALCHDLLSSARESGTLPLLLAQPVRLRTLVAATIAVRAAPILAVTTALSAGAIGLATGFRQPADGVRLVLWLSVTTLHAAWWLALCAGLNARRHSSAFNATVLTGVWVATVVILPAAGALVGSHRHPVPSRIEMVHAVREARNEARRSANEEALRTAFLARHRDRIHDEASLLSAMRTIVEDVPAGHPLLDAFLSRHPELAASRRLTHTGLFYMLLAAQEEEVERRTQPLRDHLSTSRLAQLRMRARWRSVLPPLLVDDAYQRIAGTDTARYQRFFDQVAVYQAAQRACFWPRLVSGRAFELDDLAQLPVFVYREEPLACLALDVLGQLSRLGGVVLLTAGLAALAYRRFSVAG